MCASLALILEQHWPADHCDGYGLCFLRSMERKTEYYLDKLQPLKV
jgi:hypothetical protein